MPTEPRRLVILTEGQFGVHHAKTAMGVIRYGRDEIVAVLDSTIAGRNVSRVACPATTSRSSRRSTRRSPCPAARTRCSSASRRPAASCPRDWRTTILEAIARRARRPLRAAHVPRRRPEFAAAAAAAGTRIVDYRRPPDRMETAVGRRHGPGKRVILTVGTDCAIGKMSVALELRAAARRAGDSAVVRPDRPDRDDDRGLGRGGRPGHQRLRPGHRRVDASRRARAAATGSSSRARARSTTRPTRR